MFGKGCIYFFFLVVLQRVRVADWLWCFYCESSYCGADRSVLYVYNLQIFLHICESPIFEMRDILRHVMVLEVFKTYICCPYSVQYNMTLKVLSKGIILRRGLIYVNYIFDYLVLDGHGRRGIS